MKQAGLYTIIFVILALVLVNCRKEEVVMGPVPLKIEIDSSKIDGIEIDSVLGISFHPPFLWENYNSEISERVESVKNINKTFQKKFQISPKHLYFKFGSNNLLSVGEIVSLDTTIKSSQRIEEYINLISDKFEPEKVLVKDYLKDGFELKHIKSEFQNLISSKYIFESETGKIIQFDYTYRRNDDLELEKTILSSVGTIQRN